MLRFFRQIRHRLLDTGRISKYLLYAIGEILLVVIGILIALQVNNWNSDRLSREQSAKYLNRLQDEIEQMARICEQGMPLIREDHQEALEALRFVESCGQEAHLEDSFIRTLQYHQTLMKYSEIRNTYDEMISVGAFAHIDDSDMKSKVFRAYNAIAVGQTQIDYFRDEVGRASAVINDTVTFSYDQNGAVTVAYDVANLCTNSAFRNALVEIVDSRGDWMSGLGMIAAALDQALEAIRSTGANRSDR